jgi:hypothetical protein
VVQFAEKIFLDFLAFFLVMMAPVPSLFRFPFHQPAQTAENSFIACITRVPSHAITTGHAVLAILSRAALVDVARKDWRWSAHKSHPQLIMHFHAVWILMPAMVCLWLLLQALHPYWEPRLP